MSSNAYQEHDRPTIACECGQLYSKEQMRYLSFSKEYTIKCPCGMRHYADP